MNNETFNENCPTQWVNAGIDKKTFAGIHGESHRIGEEGAAILANSGFHMEKIGENTVINTDAYADGAWRKVQRDANKVLANHKAIVKDGMVFCVYDQTDAFEDWLTSMHG